MTDPSDSSNSRNPTSGQPDETNSINQLSGSSSTADSTESDHVASELASSSSSSSRRRRRSISDESPSKRRSRFSPSSLRNRISQMGSSVMSSLLPDRSKSSSSSASGESSSPALPLEPAASTPVTTTTTTTTTLPPVFPSSPLGSLIHRHLELSRASNRDNRASTPRTARSSALASFISNQASDSSTASPLSTGRSPPSPALPSIVQRPSSRFFPSQRSSSSGTPSSLNPLLLSLNRQSNTARPSTGSTTPFVGTPGPRRRTLFPTPPSSISGRDASTDDQATVLARLLAIAATATASSLVDNDRTRTGTNPFRRNMFGNSSSPPPNTTPTSFSNPTSETSFDGFMAGLRSGLLAAELSNSLHNANQASPRRAMNFFRMFRFTTSDPPVNTSEPNLVPILIVGVRAVENNETPEGTSAASSNPSQSEDTDSTVSTDSSLNSNTQIPEPSRTRPSEGLLNLFENNEDEPLFNPPASGVDMSTWNVPRSSTSPSSTRTNQSRDSLIDALNERYGANLNSPTQSEPLSSANTSSTAPTTEPQPTSSDTTTPSTTESNSEGPARQSWIVYVFGGTYPENHPILLAPTLFSDDPSYEDLMILESFMGQVKPPVATKEEVKNSGGLFNIGVAAEDGTIVPTPEGRCLICLGDFEQGEKCRMLAKCSHAFHCDCIDQWLLTGRNSCPLCRGEGVKKSDQPSEPPFPSMPAFQ